MVGCATCGQAIGPYPVAVFDVVSFCSVDGLLSLRFDLRGHSESERRPEELTLFGAANDVRAASEFLMAETGTTAVGIIASSFGGELAVWHAAGFPAMVARMGLINPLLFYKLRFVGGRSERWRAIG